MTQRLRDRLFWFAILAGAFALSCARLHVERLVLRDLPAKPGGLPPVLGRASWRPAPPRGTPSAMGKPYRVTVHHSGGPVNGDFDRASAARTIRGIQAYHQQGRGWADIAYHYVVDRGGRIWEGRPATQVGAHAGSAKANRGNIGVVLLGNFDLQVPSGSQIAALDRLLKALCRVHHIARSSVFGHDALRKREGLGPTKCPGRWLRGWIRRFRGG